MRRKHPRLPFLTGHQRPTIFDRIMKKPPLHTHGKYGKLEAHESPTKKNNFLDNRQHAFRPDFGTETYFAVLNNILVGVLYNEQHVEIISLDLAIAYNRAWIPNILKQLVAWEISENDEETGVPHAPGQPIMVLGNPILLK